MQAHNSPIDGNDETDPAPLTRKRWWALFGKGAFDALSFPAWMIALALFGVGSLARDVGHPIEAAMLSTLLVWAGPAQVIFYGGLAANVPLPTIALAVCLSSIRFLPMTMAFLPLLRGPHTNRFTELLAAHYISITVWTESLRRLPTMPRIDRVPYFFGFANACIILTTLSTGVGYLLVGAVPGPLAAGLLAVTPIFFTISLTAGARIPADWLALGLGFALEPIALAWLGPGFDLMGVGLVGGTLAFLIGGAIERRRA